ncbi:hypothetical protein Tco_1533949 [Tanacetum coccineum]
MRMRCTTKILMHEMNTKRGLMSEYANKFGEDNKEEEKVKKMVKDAIKKRIEEGITDSDTSSDTKSDASSNDIVSSRGPYAYLLQWYDNGFDESVPGFKFNKRTICKSNSSKKRPSNSKQVPTLQPGFVLPLSTVGSVADNKGKGKKMFVVTSLKSFQILRLDFH